MSAGCKNDLKNFMVILDTHGWNFKRITSTVLRMDKWRVIRGRVNRAWLNYIGRYETLTFMLEKKNINIRERVTSFNERMGSVSSREKSVMYGLDWVAIWRALHITSALYKLPYRC